MDHQEIVPTAPSLGNAALPYMMHLPGAPQQLMRGRHVVLAAAYAVMWYQLSSTQRTQPGTQLQRGV